MPVLSSKQRGSLRARILEYHLQLKSPEGQSHYSYLTEVRGFTPQTIDRFLLGAVIDPDALDEPARDRIAIPFLTPSGPVALRFRRPPWIEEGPKYWQPAGSTITLFNPQGLIEADEYVLCCEGELDTVTLAQCGLPAVGIPGASAWRDHFAPLFEGYEKVIICTDNDDSGAGQEFAKKVAASVPGPHPIMFPKGHDVNSYFMEVGVQGIRDFLGVDKKVEEEDS